MALQTEAHLAKPVAIATGPPLGHGNDCVNNLTLRLVFRYRRPFLFAGLPDPSPFYLKAVFAWIPEYLLPELAITGIPCPRCGCKGKSDGWSPKEPRWVFMEDDVAYIIGFR